MNGLAVRLVPYLLAFFSSLCIMVLELVASRLVARHVGVSLPVWTGVIGIMLGGICLGNVLGGRLADRMNPAHALGPLYAMGSALTLGALVMNALVGFVPGLTQLPLAAQTILVVSLDFLVPGTVLGMIGPVVAKMAVEGARRSGGALGDVYFMGAVGSIVGTFLAGFVLLYLAPISSIIALVAASLAVLAMALLGTIGGALLGAATAAALFAGAGLTMMGLTSTDVTIGSLTANAPTLLGMAFSVLLAVYGIHRLRVAGIEATSGPIETDAMTAASGPKIALGDLSTLAFVASLAFMALEMVAGRLVTRHLGSSIYGWTSVIGVLLGGLSLGNWLGGRIANRVTEERQLATLFLAASVLTAGIILAETPRQWMVRNPIGYFFQGAAPDPLAGDTGPFLTQVSEMTGIPWALRVLVWVAIEFLPAAVAMGTVGPVVAKLAVERVRLRSKGTGAAIGQVYAWGMVGSILGTFLTSFVLINAFGTKGLILLLATMMAIAATILGRIWHAAWAGIPLGMCVIAFGPFVPMEKLRFKPARDVQAFLLKQGRDWGLRDEAGDPETTSDAIAYADESDYYYVKITNEPEVDSQKRTLQKRTLVLDNLIHGYFFKDHPEQLDYDYEHVYALVTKRVMNRKALAAKGGKAEDQPLSTLFLGGGSYTFPRYLQHVYPKTRADVAEIDPAVTEANHLALWLPRDTSIRTTWGDARQFVANRRGVKYDLIFGDAFNDFSVPWHLTTREFNDKLSGLLTDDGVYMINIIDKYTSEKKAMVRELYNGEVAAVARALASAGAEDSTRLAETIVLGLDKEDLGVDSNKLARVAIAAIEGVKTLRSAADLRARIAPAIAGVEDAMRGKTDRLLEVVRKLLSEDEKTKGLPGRIDAWTVAAVDADRRYATEGTDSADDASDGAFEARESGSFLGSWVATARKTFGANVYVFGTAGKPGGGNRETFVIVASRQPLDLDQLGFRDDDFHIYDRNGAMVTPVPYDLEHMDAIKLRSRGIILTDDYAPVENLLAPVARTRGLDD